MTSKPVIRKNCLFAGSETSGQRLAILYSFAATCKANNICFRHWLEDVMPKLSTIPASWIDSLLPPFWKPEAKYVFRKFRNFSEPTYDMYLTGRLPFKAEKSAHYDILQEDCKFLRWKWLPIILSLFQNHLLAGNGGFLILFLQFRCFFPDCFLPFFYPCGKTFQNHFIFRRQVTF